MKSRLRRSANAGDQRRSSFARELYSHVARPKRIAHADTNAAIPATNDWLRLLFDVKPLRSAGEEHLFPIVHDLIAAAWNPAVFALSRAGLRYRSSSRSPHSACIMDFLARNRVPLSLDGPGSRRELLADRTSPLENVAWLSCLLFDGMAL